MREGDVGFVENEVISDDVTSIRVIEYNDIMWLKLEVRGKEHFYIRGAYLLTQGLLRSCAVIVLICFRSMFIYRFKTILGKVDDVNDVIKCLVKALY